MQLGCMVLGTCWSVRGAGIIPTNMYKMSFSWVLQCATYLVQQIVVPILPRVRHCAMQAFQAKTHGPTTVWCTTTDYVD